MDHNIINEIRRINDIMSGKQVLSEQIVPKILKKFFSVLDDDAARKVLRATDNTQDDIIRKLRAGETLSDDAMEILLRVIDYDFLAKSLIDQKLLGDKLNNNIQKIINILKENPGRYDELTKKMDEAIDTFGLNQEFPDELINSIKKDVRNRIDDSVKSADEASSIADNINIDELIDDISKKADNVSNVSEFETTLKNFLTENRKRLTPMFTSRDIDRYVKEITGQLNVVLSKGKNSKNFKNIENIWSKLPLSEQEKIATEAIEKMTKNLPLNVKNLITNPKKFIERVVKGANGKFEFDVFMSNLKKTYIKLVLIQIVREIWKVTQTRSKQKSGYQVGVDGWVESLLDGRSWEEFFAGLAVPPVEWFATIMSYADRNTTYDEIREMLPPSYRDNFYRDETDNMFIEKGGVKYPVYVKENHVVIEIDGEAYKLEDIDF